MHIKYIFIYICNLKYISDWADVKNGRIQLCLLWAGVVRPNFTGSLVITWEHRWTPVICLPYTEIWEMPTMLGKSVS